MLSPADVVGSGLCIGCGSCVAQAPDSAAKMTFDDYGQLLPHGQDAWVRQASESFTRTCPFSPAAANEDLLADELFVGAPTRHPATGRFIGAYVGYVAHDAFRERGSSGGMTSWVLTELLTRGLVDGVAHVVASTEPSGSGDFFHYRIARSVEEITAGAKSRYYPVELAGVLREIRAVPGRYAVVGVPCFVKAVQLLRREDPIIRERVAFTVGLFCGHMKSARFVESFAWQLGVELDDVVAVDFRRKDPSRPASTYTAELTLRSGERAVRDWWNLADGDWGAGFFQNSACNFCDDVVGETADISFGDAWVEPYSSDGWGTNVVVVRSPVVHDIVREGVTSGALTLEPVDGDFVRQTQDAGLRHRRAGLAYRLTWRRRGIRPVKRVAPDRNHPVRRKLIYRMRAHISFGSHRVFWLARRLRRPHLYVRWANGVAAVYHAFAYSRGRLGAWVDRLLPPP